MRPRVQWTGGAYCFLEYSSLQSPARIVTTNRQPKTMLQATSAGVREGQQQLHSRVLPGQAETSKPTHD